MQESGVRSQDSGVSPDEKIFTPTDERGFLPHTLHPTPHTLHPTPHTPLPHLLNCVSKYSKRL
ncbi:MAG: hypothetical protein EWV41_10620 [Microcystis wesenbergii Mw_MB_S_20031200_S109]|uniref:Uncharacterized protein n=1 Tax=Microcystis wesenbergii Mw_MB_S_20031200_S109D TaxID=2486241 RepID=A0A552LDR0_9CHRO|nr:MAG: hypothetical protein EWV41_10620 [Microcystis wesenbergii Mw_MB_S_20031200_S109]TRV18355.1 MAG: hypothetical protein EWV88_20890 [Microcystis wesenbergii Mw_MB_S_20031200_S109D]